MLMPTYPHLGKTGTDKITGFSGIITGYVQYVTGCAQLLLQPQELKDGSPVGAIWYDEQRVEIQTAAPIVLDNSRTPGACDPAPIR